MGTKQHNVRWNGWLFNAIEEWRKRRGNKSFSDSVNYLLACELERRGYKQEYFEPSEYDRIKLKNLLKYTTPNLKKEIELGMGYLEVIEKHNIIINSAVIKAQKDDTADLHIPSFEEELELKQGNKHEKSILQDKSDKKIDKAV